MKELSVYLQIQLIDLLKTLAICEDINDIYQLQAEAKELIAAIEAEYEAQA